MFHMKNISTIDDFITNKQYKSICTVPSLSTLYKEINLGNVYYTYTPNNFYILIDRGDWSDFYFYINSSNETIPSEALLKPLISTFIRNNTSKNSISPICIDFFKKNNFNKRIIYQYFVNTTLAEVVCSNFPKNIYYIDNANLVDFTSIKDIIFRYLKRLGRLIPTDEEIIELIQNKEIFVVRTKGDNDVIAIKMIKYTGKTAADHGIAVDEHHRGNQIAKALTIQSFQKIKKRNCIRTDAWIEQTNTISIKLHLQCGYIANERYMIKYIQNN